ncbi:DNA cytosine methyltransferase [Flavobacterium sp. 102]|uniref:DNA cytosine methyltransferase n=1 Tax=Flavobacterium sp. 102 TaxID=2135623 RepID=UPI000F1EC702|nr:DNA (cytosine-5-)-methyltransferase [Flavobacterium sp. 102]RKS01702.1 DNA (cytosine-5)-methyltransferase 1 [Flavobacterium sp. 102]
MISNLNMTNNNIPIIDLFAGPGGLGEGFSSVLRNGERVFDIKLSIEKDNDAHKTLELRSFFRKFKKGKVPNEYYDVLKENDLQKRDNLIITLFEKYPRESQEAKKEAWKAELGNESYPSSTIDEKIIKSLSGNTEWLLIGGPPCQAFSLAGRSRVGGIDDDDHRVYLYKEYLRIIAVHHPTVFVMENVKGLLSAKVNDEKVFDWILSDLRNPSSVFKETNAPKYKIYSLSNEPESFDEFGNPKYKDNRDYLIQSEKFKIPQKRHRVILLGVREDINIKPEILKMVVEETDLKSVIGDLPKLRSGIGRSIISSEIINGVKKREYKNEIDSKQNWQNIINSFKKEITTWKGLESNIPFNNIEAASHGLGSEYIEYKTPCAENPLREWFVDDNLKGVCNHETRTHLVEDLKRYLFASTYAEKHKRFPRLKDYQTHSSELMPDHASATSGKFADRFRVQMPDSAATTITSHISKDGHYFIHYDSNQCRSLTVREAARIQTFPDNYLFCGPRTSQYHQVGNAVPPFLAYQIAEIVTTIFNLDKK